MTPFEWLWDQPTSFIAWIAFITPVDATTGDRCKNELDTLNDEIVGVPSSRKYPYGHTLSVLHAMINWKETFDV